MGANAGGGGRAGRGGGNALDMATGAEKAGEVVREANKVQQSSAQLLSNLRSGKVSPDEAQLLERQLYRTSQDAFFKEKNYEKAHEFELKYKAVQEVNRQFKAEQDAKKQINWGKVTTKPNASSVRDEGPSGRQMTNEQIQARMKKLGKYNPPKGEPMGNPFY